MSDVRDFGIAVRDAIRLNDCWYQLHQEFAKRPSVDGDADLWWSQANCSEPDMADWIHQNRSRNVADMTLRRAIRDRQLPLWVRLESGEELIDLNALKEVNYPLMATGTYQPMNDHGSWLTGRPLWVKSAVWAAFYKSTMIARYGKLEAASVVRDLLLPLPAALEGIGPVMGVDEAVSWTAFGKVNSDVIVTVHANGHVEYRDESGNVIPKSGPGSGKDRLENYRDAHKSVLRALQMGELIGYVQTEGGVTLSIPRLYWNSSNSKMIEVIYSGTATSDAGAGNPVLLARDSFFQWRSVRQRVAATFAKERRGKDEAKPPLSEKGLADWFEALSSSDRSLATDKLWSLCKSANPANSITRERVRQLLVGRKPGPRPFSGKMTA